MSGVVLSGAAVLAMAATCAPDVAAPTMAAIVRTESGGHPYIIGVNGPGGGARRFETAAEADAEAERLIAAGANVDVGIAQLNWRSGHLQRRGLPLSAAFEPCTALRVGSEVLVECWTRATGATEQARLRAAVGCYNAGYPRVGTAYVMRVLASAGIGATSAVATSERAPPPAARVIATKAPYFLSPYAADTAVFAREMPHALRIE